MFLDSTVGKVVRTFQMATSGQGGGAVGRKGWRGGGRAEEPWGTRAFPWEGAASGHERKNVASRIDHSEIKMMFPHTVWCGRANWERPPPSANAEWYFADPRPVFTVIWGEEKPGEMERASDLQKDVGKLKVTASIE